MISNLQTALVDALRANAYIADSASGSPKPIAVLAENIGEPSIELTRQVESLGISILVTTPEVRNPHPAKPKILATPEWVVQITETVVLNQSATGTNKKAIDVAVEVAKALHFFQSGQSTRLEFDAITRQNDVPLILWVTFKNTVFLNP